MAAPLPDPPVFPATDIYSTHYGRNRDTVSPVNTSFARSAWRLSGRWPDGVLFEGYGHDGPGVRLGDGQTEAYLRDTDMTGLVPPHLT